MDDVGGAEGRGARGRPHRAPIRMSGRPSALTLLADATDIPGPAPPVGPTMVKPAPSEGDEIDVRRGSPGRTRRKLTPARLFSSGGRRPHEHVRSAVAVHVAPGCGDGAPRLTADSEPVHPEAAPPRGRRDRRSWTSPGRTRRRRRPPKREARPPGRPRRGGRPARPRSCRPPRRPRRPPRLSSAAPSMRKPASPRSARSTLSAARRPKTTYAEPEPRSARCCRRGPAPTRTSSSPSPFTSPAPATATPARSLRRRRP